MKRKLDHDDKPVDASKVEASVSTSGFNTFGLDTRILQGIAKEKFFKPTLVQEKAIPLALEGKDILARAKTGSGKTAAYLLPIIQSILRKKPFSDKSTTALILVPTRELADQVLRAIESLTSFCTRDVRAINLTQKVSDAVQRSLLADFPDIVITTPARAALNVNNGALSLEKLGHLVIDEADLVLSYGYEDDLQTISQSTPQGIQTFLMSATLTTEVDTLKGLFCRNPVTLRLEEAEDDGSGLSQYMVKCAEDEKFLLLYVIFKLKLIKGKCIIFVADIDRCYRLKLFLEQFGIKSCVLNSELPVNSRLHIVQEFNKNVYDIIIATDENEVVGDEEDEAKEAIPVEEEEKTGEEMSKKRRKDELDPADPAEKGNENGTITKKKKKAPKRDREYGVSRGIDFRAVSCVVNFDLPASSKSYTHRIGRTARAGRSGMALSFVIPSELYRKHKATSHTCAANDEATLAKITKSQAKKGHEIKPYAFDMQAVEGFRYRMNDALRAVTGIAIRAARTRELRQELLKSEKLRRHFEENPEDLKGLRHDSELRSARIQPHLKHVPEYLLPQGGKNAVAKDVGFVGIGRTSENRIRKARARNKFRGKKATSKKADPLKTFNAKERGK